MKVRKGKDVNIKTQTKRLSRASDPPTCLFTPRFFTWVPIAHTHVLAYVQTVGTYMYVRTFALLNTWFPWSTYVYSSIHKISI